MTITEAAACETPAVVTRIAGHSDAVLHGVTGILVDTPSRFGDALEAVLHDAVSYTHLDVYKRQVPVGAAASTGATPAPAGGDTAGSTV